MADLTPQPRLPDFYTWVGGQPGYDDASIMARVRASPALADKVIKTINKDLTNVQAKGPELVKLYLKALAEEGDTATLTNLQNSYIHVSDATARQIGTEIAAADKAGDVEKSHLLQAEAKNLKAEVPVPGRFQLAVDAAKNTTNRDQGPRRPPGVDNAGVVPPPKTLGAGTAGQPLPPTVTTGDLNAMAVTNPLSGVLQNLAQLGQTTETEAGNRLMVAGAGPAVHPEQFQTTDWGQVNAQGQPVPDFHTQAKPDAVAAIEMQNTFDENMGTRNRFLRANGEKPVSTANLTVAGIPESGVMSLNQALRIPQTLTDQQFIKFQQNLAAAGMFSDGDPRVLLSNMIRWGDRSDGATLDAWQRLLNIVATGDTSIAETLTNKQASYLPLLQEAAKTERTDAINKLVGDLHLTNPADIKATAEQAFVNLIGRAPTEAELEGLVSGFHGKETSAYQSKVTAANKSIGQGNLFENTTVGQVPAFGGNGDPRFTQRGYDIVAWAADWLNYIGAPITASNLGVVAGWANSESSGYNPAIPGGRNNPLNIVTSSGDGNVGQGGSQGNIGDYPSPQVGAQASANLFLNNRNAAPIIAAFRANAGSGAVLAAVNHFYQGWGGSIGFGALSVPPERAAQLDKSHPLGLGTTLPGVTTSRALTGDTGLNIGPGATSFEAGLNRVASPATIVDPGSVQAFVEEQARTAHPVEYQSKSLGDQYFQLLHLLGGAQPTPQMQ